MGKVLVRRGTVGLTRLACALFIILVLLPSTALADTWCVPSRCCDDYPQSHFAAWLRAPGGPEIDGVQADVYAYQPYVASVSSKRDETVMTIAIVNSDGSKILQDGVLTDQNYYFYNFCEAFDRTTNVRLKDMVLADISGQTLRYTATYKEHYTHSGRPKLTCSVNGSQFDELAPEPFTPVAAEIFGETHTWTSMMPGVPSAVERFSNATIDVPSVGGWTLFGAHNPGSSQDIQATEFIGSDGKSTGLQYTYVDATNPAQNDGQGGSYFDGAYGTDVFEGNLNTNTLVIGDLSC